MPMSTLHSQDIPEEVAQIHKAMGREVDVTLDCAGFNKTMSTALGATRAGGKTCLIGMGHGVMTVPLTPAAVRYCFMTPYALFIFEPSIVLYQNFLPPALS